MGEEAKLLGQKLDDHITADERRFDSIENHMKNQASAILNIKDNHLHTLQKDIDGVKIQVGKISTDLDWLKRFFWIVATASVGSLIGTALNLIFRLS